MSTEYRLAERLCAVEGSAMIQIVAENPDVEGEDLWSERMDEHQLRTAIIKMVEVLSYVSSDPEEALARFNVKYGQTV